jgi:hypothetical protein
LVVAAITSPSGLDVPLRMGKTHPRDTRPPVPSVR